MRRTIRGNTYEIDEEFIDMLKLWKGYILVFGGPSGVGKTTISEAMNLPTIRSVTTREIRKDYETYDFISKREFKQLYKRNKFGSVLDYGEDKYGFTKEAFIQLALKNKVLVTTMSPLGYRMLKQRYPRTIGVFVHADKDIVMNRLLNRDGFIDEIRSASYESNLRSKDYYHIHVNNSSKPIKLLVLGIKFKLTVIRLLDLTKRTYGLRKRLFKTLNTKVKSSNNNNTQQTTNITHTTNTTNTTTTAQNAKLPYPQVNEDNSNDKKAVKIG